VKEKNREFVKLKNLQSVSLFFYHKIMTLMILFIILKWWKRKTIKSS